MTKFEEKLEILPIKTIQHPVGDTKYYTAVHVKTLIAQADEEIANLKSKLQQQALPVVPECVAEWIEYVKKDELFNALGLLDNDNMPKDVDEWLFLQSNDDNINLILRAWLDGYTVKEKRFYLKHKSVLIFDPDSDDSDVEELYLGAGGNFVPYKHLAKIFTQQEIDSMETGSYEQIEVEK